MRRTHDRDRRYSRLLDGPSGPPPGGRAGTGRSDRHPGRLRQPGPRFAGRSRPTHRPSPSFSAGFDPGEPRRDAVASPRSFTEPRARNSAGLFTRFLTEVDRPPIELTEGHLAFLEGCVDAFETDDHIFVHASYDPVLPMSEQPTSLLRWQSLRRGLPGPHVSGKMVVAGHTSQKNGKILKLGHLVCIDTYCYGGGWLTALDVHSGATWQVDARGRFRRPRARAERVIRDRCGKSFWRMRQTTAQEEAENSSPKRQRVNSPCSRPVPCDWRIHSLALWACTVGFSIHTTAWKFCHTLRDSFKPFAASFRWSIGRRGGTMRVQEHREPQITAHGVESRL